MDEWNRAITGNGNRMNIVVNGKMKDMSLHDENSDLEAVISANKMLFPH